MGANDDDRQLSAICSLDDPTRRRLYRYVASQGEPVTRDQASTELEIDRAVVAYHLDRLVEVGLLTASFARPPGRGGPGAGRPAKRYERPDAELAVTVPPRDYRLAAELLARAAADDASGAVRDALRAAAASYGRRLAAERGSRDLTGLLRRQGFEPYEEGTTLRLRNCPFHTLAQEHTELVCTMNHALLAAAAGEMPDAVTATQDPAPGRCCVAFTRRPA